MSPKYILTVGTETEEIEGRAPAIEEALFILVKGYDALGMNELRDDADRVLRKNFPDSGYLKRSLDKSEPWWKLWK